VELRPFYQYRPKLLEYVKSDVVPFVEPHIIAAQAVVNACTRFIDLHDMPAVERCAFVFDRHFRFQGPVEDLMRNYVIENLDVPRQHRLGYLWHADKKREVLLQVADVLAHEEYKHVSGERERWQYAALSANGQIFSRETLNASFMKLLIDHAIAAENDQRIVNN
jgi:hypothetical protein